jgi:hypothetical protein
MFKDQWQGPSTSVFRVVNLVISQDQVESDYEDDQHGEHVVDHHINEGETTTSVYQPGSYQ